jgi:hypothetical protein
MNDAITNKPKRGRLKKAAASEQPAQKPKLDWKSKFGDASKWNGELASENENRLAIDPEILAACERNGISLEWKTESIFGQPQEHHMSVLRRNGWQAVQPGEIPGLDTTAIGGCVLMARPAVISAKAKARDQAEARSRITTMEQRHMLGDLGTAVTLDSRHSSAKAFNHHKRSLERLQIPGDE